MGTKLTTLTFIKKAKIVHGSLYSYQKVNYVLAKHPITIICQKHGEFTQTPDTHLSGKGCRRCGTLKNTHNAQINKQSKLSFIDKAKVVHGDKFNYSQVVYTSYHTDVAIICNKCKVQFKQRPSNHLTGSGCGACSNNIKLTTEVIKNRALVLNGDKFSYDNLVYVNRDTKFEIKCNSCMTSFFQNARNHITNNRGCPNCAKHGFNPNKPAILYYLNVCQGQGFKIGVTNNSVQSRYSKSDLINIKILKITHFNKGSDALQSEQHILTKYKAQLLHLPLLKDGNSEIFKCDVLCLNH